MDHRRAQSECCDNFEPSVKGTQNEYETITVTVADPLQLTDPTTTIVADSLKLPPIEVVADPPQLPLAFQRRPLESVRACWPADLVDRVRKVVDKKCAQPTAPEFLFELSREAAEHNAAILHKYNFQLGDALLANSTTPLRYGSEFREVETLHSILHRHPNWSRLRSLLVDGSKWPLYELSDEQRKADLIDALTFGNHKGATSNPDLLKDLCKKDVIHGFGLVIPISTVQKIPGALLAPMNIMEQSTIDEHGNIIPKKRLTHDQSFVWSSGTSVNSRVQVDKLLPCRFGACMRRLANFAVAARKRYPNCRIYASKVDYKSAYRRCHLNHETAVQTITQLPDNDIAIISLRLTFGGGPCPFEWGVLSETACDLANALLHDDSWDPDSLCAPASVPPRRSLDEDVPFGVGRDLIVDVPIDSRGTVDCYIDDTIGLTIDLPGTNNVKRMEKAPLLAIHALSRPVHEQEPIPRDEMTAEEKLFAEGGLDEQKIILGWFFDFRRLMVALPENKFVAWSDSIKNMLTSDTSTPHKLEQLIGRMGHIGSILPTIYHFLSRLRDLHFRSRNRRKIALTKNCRKDLQLMLDFLEFGRKGIDLNIVAYLAPTHIYHSDSCPAGLGGYSNDGFAWRFQIPPNLQFRASNNLLEFLAAIITPWIDIIAGRLSCGDCVLSMTDSTTAEGWMHKTNFREVDDDQVQVDVRIEAARKFATIFTEHGIKSYSQWFPGRENIVADALSRDDDRTDDELTSILYCFAPHQMPSRFEIAPLPRKIASWLISLLSNLPVREEFREAHMRTKLGRGGDGTNTVCQSDSTTLTSMGSTSTNGSSSWERLPWLCAKADFPETMEPWLKEQSEVPSHMWFRPSGRTDGQTPPKTKIWSLDSFYTDYSVPSNPRIQK